jgi:hypothetical protein
MDLGFRKEARAIHLWRERRKATQRMDLGLGRRGRVVME